MNKPGLPAKEEVIGMMAEVIADRCGVDLMLARSTAADVLSELQRPGRELGKRALGASEAADLIGHELIEAMKGQLLIVFVNRLGGKIEIPVSEVDGTGDWMLGMTVDVPNGRFTFETRRKQ